MSSPIALLLASAMFLPAAVLHFVCPSMRCDASRLYMWLGLAIIAAFAVAAFFGSYHDTLWLAASLLPVTGSLLASLKPTQDREFAATSATLFCMVGGWATLTL
jgi:hypothetical protein